MRRALLRFRSASILDLFDGATRASLCLDVETDGAIHRDCMATALRVGASDDWKITGGPVGYGGPPLEPTNLDVACSAVLNRALRPTANVSRASATGGRHENEAALPIDGDFTAEIGLVGPGGDDGEHDGGEGHRPGVPAPRGTGVGGRVTQAILRLYQSWNGRFPRLRGRGVLLELLSVLTRAGAPRPAVAGDEGILLGFGRDFVTMTVATRGSFEPLLSQRLRALTPPGGVWIDVGANVGYVSMLAARWVGPLGRVYSFEPARQTFDRLRANLALNRVTNVVPFQLGCSSAVGEVELVVPGEDLGRSHVAQAGEQGERVAIVTLDAHFASQPLDRLDFLKIDAEGHDLEVLKGARELLRRWHPPVLLEVGNVPGRSLQESISEARDLLEPHGYRCELLAHESAYDLLFLPNA
jgi:FkbM family methyltransferase